MKTHYKILWIDDAHHYVRGDKRILERFFKDHGIELEIVKIEVTDDKLPTQHEPFKKAVSDIELDMVFIDFNMPENGTEVIYYIRKKISNYYLPILFYTSDSNAQVTLQKHILDANQSEDSTDKIVDGVYFCDRDHIAEKAKLILGSLMIKENQIQQVRGLLMDRVSEIDANLTECLNNLLKQVPKGKEDKILGELKERLRKKKNQFLELLNSPKV